MLEPLGRLRRVAWLGWKNRKWLLVGCTVLCVIRSGVRHENYPTCGVGFLSSLPILCVITHTLCFLAIASLLQ